MGLKMTADAGKVLRENLERNRADENTCFRFVVDEKGEGALAIDKPTEKDETFEDGDRVVLAVAPPVADSLDGQTLDYNTEKSSLYLHR